MNKYRRKEIDMLNNELQDIIDKIKAAQSTASDIQSDEQDYMDNIPENLQSSERYEAADAAISELDDVDSALDEAVDSIQSAIDALESAKWGGM